MASKLVVGVWVCVVIAIVHSAPQFDQQYSQQLQQQQFQQSSTPNPRFAVVDGSFHQDPNLEYNFQSVQQ